MPRFMKKNSFGLMVEASGGADDYELTEVRMTDEEYNELLEKIDSLEKDLERTKKEFSKREIQMQRDANQRITACKEKAENEKNDLLEKLHRQENLNVNLKRITRERANAQRGLEPKKEHSGYLVMLSTQYRQHYGRGKVANVWKSVLQTPYNSSLPLNQIKSDIWRDLMDEVLYPMGVRKVQTPDKNGEYEVWLSEDRKREVCGLYGWSFKANYKSGFWEIDLYHTKSIKVPEEYRPKRRY